MVTASSERIGVLIVDDHPVIQDALSSAINSTEDMRILGVATSVHEALALAEVVHPDVAIVDLRLKASQGANLVVEMRMRFPQIKILVFSMYEENLHAEWALRLGVAGYVMKTVPLSEVLEAVRAVMRGEIYISAQLEHRILNMMLQGKGAKAPALNLLTAQEQLVLQMLTEGRSVEETAASLDVPLETVRTYLQRLREKLL